MPKASRTTSRSDSTKTSSPPPSRTTTGSPSAAARRSRPRFFKIPASSRDRPCRRGCRQHRPRRRDCQGRPRRQHRRRQHPFHRRARSGPHVRLGPQDPRGRQAREDPASGRRTSTKAPSSPAKPSASSGSVASGRPSPVRALAMEMKVVGYDPYFKGEAALDGRVKIVKDFDTFLAQLDVITFHVPGGGDTKHLLDGRRLDDVGETRCSSSTMHEATSIDRIRHRRRAESRPRRRCPANRCLRPEPPPKDRRSSASTTPSSRRT